MHAVVNMATTNPWYGYHRIAVMCRRDDSAVNDRQAYAVMKDYGLLQKRRRRRAPELYQAAKLFELLPQKSNDLWQMDVTYIHIPGYGWWYAVTVIDYYSRYLLACHLTHSYSAIETAYGLKLARKEAERLHGPRWPSHRFSSPTTARRSSPSGLQILSAISIRTCGFSTARRRNWAC